jgi:hypothetical protein
MGGEEPDRTHTDLNRANHQLDLYSALQKLLASKELMDPLRNLLNKPSAVLSKVSSVPLLHSCSPHKGFVEIMDVKPSLQCMGCF